MHCSAVKISAIAVLIAVAVASSALAQGTGAVAENTAIASASGITSGIRNLAESLELITAIKAGRKPADAVALQTALNAIVDLSEEEVKNLEEQLRSLGILQDASGASRTNYLAQLAMLRGKIGELRAGANENAKLADIVRFAQSVKEWRDGTYAPMIRPIVDFAAVMQNRQAIMTAHGRLIAIAKDEKKIRGFLFGGKASAFLKLLKKAQGEIAQATQMNAQARKLLDTVGDEAGGDAIDAIISDANGLIDTAYDDFVAMSRLVNG